MSALPTIVMLRLDPHQRMEVFGHLPDGRWFAAYLGGDGRVTEGSAERSEPRAHCPWAKRSALGARQLAAIGAAIHATDARTWTVRTDPRGLVLERPG